jgi:ABC-type transport system substrate-binding protein
VRFYLDEPKAIFVTRTLTTPIVQEKEWEQIVIEARKAEKPLTTLLNHNVESPVGCGPFVLQERKQGAYLFLRRNENFFGKGKIINNRSLGPFVDGLIFKIFGTSDAAILALQKGTIDMFWWGVQPGYLEDLEKAENIRIFSNEKSALYYMGFKLREPPLNDVHLRQAITMLIDKDFIVARVLQGRGIKMYSIVPPGNRFWFCPEVSKYCDGLERRDRVKKAYDLLREAGYTWENPPVDGEGNLDLGKGIQTPDGTPLGTITILTPPADYDPQRAMAGMIIQEWLRAVGISASSKPMAFSSLIEQVKVRREFNAFILGYGNLSLDPDYMRSFFHSRNDKVRGRNTSGYRNDAFDRLSDESASTMDKEKRKQMLWEMQKIISHDLPWVPLYNPNLVEAVRTDRFSGWVEMLGGIGNLWSFCQVKPRT